MAATGLDEARLTEAIISRMVAEIGAAENDEDGTATRLRAIATIIAEEVVNEVRQAQVSVMIPSGSVIVAVSGGGGAPAVGVPNTAPLEANNSVSGGLT